MSATPSDEGTRQTVLFHDTIFGPIHSRRFGTSLGVNLSPNDGKVCTFDCRYCEAGFNAQGPGTTGLPDRREVARRLEEVLADRAAKGQPLDVITFSGNGEPTVHPDFHGIVADTLSLRNRYFPQAQVTVLTNATRLDNPRVAEALAAVDNNCLKIDSAINESACRLDRPTSHSYDVGCVIERAARLFPGQCVVQTMLVTAPDFDNTTPAELDALCDAYRRINPKNIQIYSIDRQTPDRTLRRVPPERLAEIANHIRSATGLNVTTA